MFTRPRGDGTASLFFTATGGEGLAAENICRQVWKSAFV
jgi:hypothetical protein